MSSVAGEPVRATALRVCLVNPPFLERFSRPQRSPAVIKSGVLYFPYWLAFATGVLERDGVECHLQDAIAEGLDGPASIQRVVDFSPALVVVESSTPSIVNDVGYVEALKLALPQAVVVMVGTHVSARYQEILAENPCIDAVAVGEYDHTVRDVARALAGSTGLDAIPGLAVRKDGMATVPSPRPLIRDLDDMPFLADVYKRHLRIEAYSFSLAQYPMVMLISGRGCPNNCMFCVYPQTMHGRGYRYRSPANLVDELEFIRRELPQVREVVFEDDTFTANPQRVIEICRLIKERGIDLTWFANVRVDTGYETLRAMKGAGFRRCAVGFESGNPDILARIGKGATIEQALTFKRNCDRLGIMVHGCFMVGFPGETPDTMKQTLDFAKKLNCDSAQFYPMFLYPGTDAYRWATTTGALMTEDFTRWLTPQGGHNCVYGTGALSADDLNAFCEKAYMRYYTSVGYLTRKLWQSVVNPAEARRNLSGGFKLLRYFVSKWA